MELLNNYLAKTEYDSYEDFKNNFKINVPEGFDFATDIVDKWAEMEPDKKALIYCTDVGDGRTFTFQEVSFLSKKAASWLNRAGIKKGDRFITILRRRWEYWILAVAAARIGAVIVPISIQMTLKDIAYRVNASEAPLIIALDDPLVHERLECIFNECPMLQKIALVNKHTNSSYSDFDAEFNACEEYQEKCLAENDDEFVIYFTSGTSGYPKMAVHSRTYPLGHIVTAKFMQCVQNNGLHLTQTDSGWAKFGWGNIYGQWICGTAILAYDPERFNTIEMMQIIQHYCPTSICIPPTMYRFLLHDGLTRECVRSVKWFSTAGEPLSGQVNEQFRALTGQYIHEGFGQSEGTPITCTFRWLKVQPSSMGKLSPLYDTMIINQDGRECNIGETGEIVIRIHDRQKQIGLLKYYISNGEKTDPVVDGYYHTGDTAYQDEEGYYWYVGRVDDMIKCSGYRIGPFEIESILNTHAAVKDSAIVGAPDKIRGQIVCAVIVLKDGFTPSAELTKELQAYVKKNTAPYKYPRKIIYTDSLPKTTTGKTIRKEAKSIAS